jgi:hypothetical protein
MKRKYPDWFGLTVQLVALATALTTFANTILHH